MSKKHEVCLAGAGEQRGRCTSRSASVIVHGANTGKQGRLGSIPCYLDSLEHRIQTCHQVSLLKLEF